MATAHSPVTMVDSPDDCPAADLGSLVTDDNLGRAAAHSRGCAVAENLGCSTGNLVHMAAMPAPVGIYCHPSTLRGLQSENDQD